MVSSIETGRDFSSGASGKEPACQCRRHEKHGLNPWVGMIPWRRAWKPTIVFLPGKIPRTEEPGKLKSVGLQRVGHDWVSKRMSAHTHTHTHTHTVWDIIQALWKARGLGTVKSCLLTRLWVTKVRESSENNWLDANSHSSLSLLFIISISLKG